MNSDGNRNLWMRGQTSRREFFKAPVVAGAAGMLLGAGFPRGTPLDETTQTDSAGVRRESTISEYDPVNVKVAQRVSPDISDDDLLLLKQIGLRWADVLFGTNEDFDHMRRTQERFARFGIQIYAGRHFAYRNLKIQLGQAGRDQYIEQYQTFLRNLGNLGIPVSGHDFHPANTYTTAQVERRGYIAREFSLKDFRERIEKQRFGREYSAEEIWDNYTYFLKAMLPVAEEADVRLSLHPDDPPLAKMNGVAKVFTHYDGYRRAEKIAGGSKHWGLELCVGTWSEGGDKMGKDVFEMIRDFGGRGRIFAVHFRNVSSPLPHFVETFPDDGYQDMYRVMKTLREVGYNGTIIPDHIPQLVGDEGSRPIGTAYCITYMRALLRCANQEVG
jgi:mannonate dehydratase